MTTAAGEYTNPLPLPSQFAALTIADPPEPLAPFVLPLSPSSGQEELPGEANGGGRRGAAALPRKAWGSPPRRASDKAEVVFMEEPGSSWPVPSRGGPSSKKKHAQNPREGASGIPLAAPTAATAPSDSSQVSASAGDPIVGSSDAVCAPVDPQQKQQKEKEVGGWGAEMRTSGLAPLAATRVDLVPSKANSNPRSPRPPLRPANRQQQARPPMQNGHRGRNQQHFPGNGGNHQQQRPRHHRNPSFFPHQQPAQVVNDYSYQSAMMGLLNPPPEWGFNPSSNLQWSPNPQIAPPRINPLVPTENMFLRGYIPGPYFPEGLSYYAPSFPPIVRPPLGQSPPWFMAPVPPLAEAALQSQPANPPLPPDDHQLAPEITQQEAENVSARLRKQIEYYFSDQNLVKDLYLRNRMDNEGWIDVHIIANFPRVQSLTKDVGLILAALRTSPTVEVSVDKMRRKGEWRRWIIQRQPLLDGSLGEPRRED